MLDFAAAIEDDALAGVFGGFAFHLGEEGGEAVVVVHGPAVEGVIVALGTLDAGAHEDLGDVFGEFEDVLLDLIEVGGGAGECAALCGKELADEFVERHVGGDTFAEPLVVVERGFVGDLLRTIVEGADLHELGPFHDPHLGELLAAQQFIDENVALFGAGIGEEPVAFLKGGREADDVEVGAAEEDFVGGEVGGDDAELVELVGDVLVDVVEGGELGTGVGEIVRDDDGLCAFGEGVEAGEEEGFAAFLGDGEAGVFLDFHRVVIGGGETGERGDIAIRAIGVAGADGERDFDIGPGDDHLLGLDLDAGGLWDFALIELRAIADPLGEGVVEWAAFFKELAAGVRDGAIGLGEEERGFREGEVDAASGHFGGETEVVSLGIEAVEGEVESVLAASGAVAGAGVATGGGEDGHDIELEGNGAGFFRILDGDGDLGFESLVFDGEGGGAVFFRSEHGAVERGERGVGEGELGLAGDVVGGGVFHPRDDDDAVEVGGGFEGDFGGVGLDGCEERVGLGIPAWEGGGGARGEGFAFGPCGTGLDPFFEGGDFVGGEGFAVFFGRHAVAIPGGQADADDEFGFPGISGDDGVAGIAAFEEVGVGFEDEPAIGFFGGVTFEAAGLEDVADGIEGLGGIVGSVGASQGGQGDEDGRKESHGAVTVGVLERLQRIRQNSRGLCESGRCRGGGRR